MKHYEIFDTDHIEALIDGRYRLFCEDPVKAQILNKLFRIFPSTDFAAEGSELIWVFDRNQLAAVKAVMKV